MSLVQFFPKAVPQATRAAVEHILPADSICRLLGDKAQEIFDEAAMSEMYHHRGRGALNPVMMSIVLILQYFYNLPDREASWLELAAIETLAAVLDQQFERIEDGGAEADGADGAGSGHRVEPRAKPKADAICSPHDPDARFGVKRRTKWLGYKGQMSETMPADDDDNDIPLIADIGIHSALQDDGAALPEIQDRLEARDMLPKQQYTDSGYISGKTIEDSGERGLDLRGFAREDTRKSPGFRLGDFMIDKENRLAICPAGKQSTSFNPSKQDDVDFHARFGKQQADNEGECVVFLNHSGHRGHRGNHKGREGTKDTKARVLSVLDKLGALGGCVLSTH